MPTNAESAAKKAVIRKMAREKDFGELLARVVWKLNNGFFGNEYVACIVQKPPRFPFFDIYDAYCFSTVHTWIVDGEVGRVRVRVPREPVRDELVVEQNEILAGIPSPFRAKFWGEKAPSDGVLEWSKPIRVEFVHHRPDAPSACGPDGDCPGCEHSVVEIAPGQASLEVGYTWAWTTELHLGQERFLARWPYGSDWITLFVKKKAELVSYR